MVVCADQMQNNVQFERSKKNRVTASKRSTLYNPKKPNENNLHMNALHRREIDITSINNYKRKTFQVFLSVELTQS